MKRMVATIRTRRAAMTGIRPRAVDFPSRPALVRGVAALLRRESHGGHYHEDYPGARRDIANRTRMTLTQTMALHLELGMESA